MDVLGRTLGEELLEPTRIYAKACLDLAAQTEVHAMSHVTGGGLAANLERVMPVEVAATLDRATWTLPPVFSLVAEVGAASRDDLEATLNCGVGMVALVPPDAADRAIAVLEGTASPPGSPARSRRAARAGSASPVHHRCDDSTTRPDRPSDPEVREQPPQQVALPPREIR